VGLHHRCAVLLACCPSPGHTHLLYRRACSATVTREFVTRHSTKIGGRGNYGYNRSVANQPFLVTQKSERGVTRLVLLRNPMIFGIDPRMLNRGQNAGPKRRRGSVSTIFRAPPKKDLCDLHTATTNDFRVNKKVAQTSTNSSATSLPCRPGYKL